MKGPRANSGKYLLLMIKNVEKAPSEVVSVVPAGQKQQRGLGVSAKVPGGHGGAKLWTQGSQPLCAVAVDKESENALLEQRPRYTGESQREQCRGLVHILCVLLRAVQNETGEDGWKSHPHG